MNETVTLALPSKGAISEPTLSFLRDCGLRVEKPNPRQYTGAVPAVPRLDVLFQRVIDILYKVADGTAQLGITGLDVVHEYPHDDVMVIHENLGYGECKLLVAVPESWIDVGNMADFADVALDFREYQRRNIRIATTYPHMTRKFLHAQGIHHFTIVNAEGAIEAAPTIGYADAVVDLTQTGTTLRENHLKPIGDGVILESQACLIGNRTALREHGAALEAVRTMLEYVDASLQGKNYSQVTVNMRAANIDDIARRLAANPITRGLQGPTIAPIYGVNNGTGDQWFTITLILSNKSLLQGINVLREHGATDVVVAPVRYLFLDRSPTFERLCLALGGEQS
ncbi:MAG: ATP phosphoribosyltransferase [Anaerolineae bacterium]|nr:ATP phosphoribosyltransferase [Anaerolineae bacterium]